MVKRLYSESEVPRSVHLCVLLLSINSPQLSVGVASRYEWSIALSIPGFGNKRKHHVTMIAIECVLEIDTVQSACTDVPTSQRD
jgi:hypothetical protein